MLNSSRLREFCDKMNVAVDELGGQLVRGGLNQTAAIRAIRNWQRGLYKPMPRDEDVRRLAEALGVEINKLSQWRSSYHYAPISPRKARLVTELIVGRDVQDAMDILKFTRKRAARMVEKVLKSAIANADEAQADIENLYVSEARIDGAGVRIGTKRWIAKDRGRAHPIRKMASHIHIAVAQD